MVVSIVAVGMSNAQEVSPENDSLISTRARHQGNRVAVTDMELQNLISFADKTPDDSTEVFVERKGSESYLWY